MSNKLFQIFEAGTHVDSQGVQRTFTDADVADMAASYNPANHEAPLLVRHDPSSAYGFLPSVVKSGRRLLAEARNVSNEFRQKIKQGWKLSAGLYAPGDPRNPNPGKWALREVSAVPIPAVKGMQDPSPAFSEGEETGLIYIDFAESPVEFARNCKKGWPCGGSCISQNKQCKKTLTGQARNFAQYQISQSLATGVSSGTEAVNNAVPFLRTPDSPTKQAAIDILSGDRKLQKYRDLAKKIREDRKAKKEKDQKEIRKKADIKGFNKIAKKAGGDISSQASPFVRRDQGDGQ